MSLEFFIIIGIVNYLRKVLVMRQSMPEWNKKFLWLMYVSIGLLIIQIVNRPWAETVGHWISIIMLGWMLYVINKTEAFKTAKFFINAILPYLIVSFIDELTKLTGGKLRDTLSPLINTAQVFSVIWGIGVWVVTRRQEKELKKTRQKVLEEEQNNKVISAMKEQLEVQVVERTAELTKQKEELEHALTDLKATQAQLIQSEKMASLGELTAGIAHEIQNPLNFINNFSELNNELIEDLKSERQKNSEPDTEFEKQILNDLVQNNEKIAFHGKRADAIVKGMLQHSRKSTGVKELTDINALCDEYLRLSYHGLRAKDKSFNAEFKFDFDASIGKINIIPQDIGRVLLNLINNAFYAVNEKRKTADETYKPTVSVQTKSIAPLRGIGAKVEIRVEDNGNGIPQNIIDKIFQPFFTTKPTGQGTGLGLSLAYDIITKEHNGSIKAQSMEGEGTKFIIQLPAL